MVETGEEMPIATSEATEGPTTSRVDVIMDEPEEERPLKVVEQGVVIETALPTDAPSSQVDKGDLSELYPLLSLRQSWKVCRYLQATR